MDDMIEFLTSFFMSPVLIAPDPFFYLLLNHEIFSALLPNPEKLRYELGVLLYLLLPEGT